MSCRFEHRRVTSRKQLSGRTRSQSSVEAGGGAADRTPAAAAGPRARVRFATMRRQ